MRTQSGNALFLILIAIFLLGGVTALLVRTSGTSEETGSTEQVSIKVSELLRYTAGMQQTVNNLTLNGGCSENDISFYTTQWTGAQKYDNANTPNAAGNFGCHVFNGKGGGYQYKRIPSGLQATQSDFVIAGRGKVEGVGSNTMSELMIIAPNLSADACAQINRVLGISSYAKDGISITLPFLGVYTPASGGTIGDDNINPTYIFGKKAACMQSLTYGGMTDGAYFFYQVLIPR